MVMVLMIFMLAFAMALLFVITSAFLGFVLTRVPFVPTSKSDVEYFVKKLNISSADTFYDLGSGDGKVCFIVNDLSGAKCVGFELTWWTHLLAKIKSKFINPSQSPLLQRGEEKNFSSLFTPAVSSGQKRGLGGVYFLNQNFFKHPWTEATIIYGYLYPPLMGRVEEKFLAECQPGTKAIIRDFPFPNLKPTEIIRRPKSHEIYVYVK